MPVYDLAIGLVESHLVAAMTFSEFDVDVINKKSDLLIEIDNKLEKIELEYGPIVYKELQTRLEKTIQIFNDEVESLFMKTFSTYKPSKSKYNKKEKINKPKYISDYEKSKK